MALDGSGAPLAGAMSGGAAHAVVHAVGRAGRERRQSALILWLAAAGCSVVSYRARQCLRDARPDGE